jgi:hydroxyacylglutathione hydrolase
MKLTERVYLVGGSGYGLSQSGDCNIYLVNGGSELALIDTGGGLGVQSILENIRKDGLDPKNITKTLITHCHFDHIGGNHEIKEEIGTDIICHPADREPIETLNELSLYDMATERGLEFKATPIDYTVDNDDKIKVGDLELTVVHNPGHTPGCISFQFEENGVKSLLCGDIAGASGRLGYINGLGFVLDDWKKSIKKLLDINPQRLYPGHNTFLLNDARSHLMMYDQKMNAAWTTIVTEVG